MHKELAQYFRCVETPATYVLDGRLSGDSGFFCFGSDTICYGRSSTGYRRRNADDQLYDALQDVHFDGSTIRLPFVPEHVAGNLRYEHYVEQSAGIVRRSARKLLRDAYYLARPLMPIGVRRHFQRIHLNSWQELTFPKWPVDTNVDNLMEKLLQILIQSRGGESVPFIWFWPNGANACAVMTHDVEASVGMELCAKLMDMNQDFDVPASFQVVPERRYPVSKAFLDSLRNRGFEVNMHDLNHDGHLYSNWDEFRQRAIKINQYAKQWGTIGFRAGVLYRKQEWYDLLDFEYDMSVPNVAHLDPQRGGCCTVMPYFVGKMVELPVTATQDYSLFHILKDYSLTLWKRQFEIIMRKHGLINVIVHPDYLLDPREEDIYRKLLGLYVELRREQNVWVALPKDVNVWWRQRNQMELVHWDGDWQIEGAGKERALVAFASLENGKLTYSIKQPSGEMTKPTFSRYQSPAHA